MNPYVLIVIAIAFAGLTATEELRIAHERSQTAKQAELAASCHKEFAEYQQAAASELTKRLEENERNRIATQRIVTNVRTDFAGRIAAINARGVRDDKTVVAAGDEGGAMSGTAGSAGRTLDATAGRDRVPQCFPGDRLAELMRQAEVNTAKLLACQDAIRGLQQ